jgi:hypothetical protein
MATGTLTLALLALSAGAAPTDVVPMNSRNFQIPIHIADGQRSKIQELILFASSDQGQTWNQVSVAPPDKDAFIFYAPADGLYWFNICVVDTQGRREPPDIYKSAPRQKVLIDTLQPNIRIVSAERQGDDIVLAWEIQEEHPDLATLKLEHRTPDAPTWVWTPVSVNPALIGQARFRVATFGPVVIHMQMADQAGNIGDAQMEVRAKAGAISSSGPTVVPATLQSNATAPMAPTAAVAPAVTNGGPWTPPSPNAAPGAAGPNSTTAAQPPRSPWESPQSMQPAAMQRNDPPGMPERSGSSTPASGYQQAGGYTPDPGNRYASAAVNTGYAYPPVSAAGGLRGLGEAPGSVEVTNSTQVTLDYEVTRQGPSGVSKVEVYMTGDEGRTWQRLCEDLHPRPPMTVNLPGEGIFGLRLVVWSGAGLARRPPQPGDLPQMRIEVDTTSPVARLFPPQPDPTRRDALLLTWNASDRNLAANPITLQYAERPDGPWQTIAKELTNSGRYQWLLSPAGPFKVYLRMLVSDAAGNVGMDQTPEPVLIDLNEPEGQIKGIIKAVRRPTDH